MKRIQILTPILAGVILSLAACSPKVNSGGYVQDGNVNDQITIGKSTKDDVMSRLGSPSAQSSFGDETWYYIADRKEAYAFLKPETVEQNVIKIEFNSAGVVSKIDHYDKASGKEFDIVKRTTPTEGHTLGFFEQVIGNIGRFNRPSNNSVAPGRRPNR